MESGYICQNCGSTQYSFDDEEPGMCESCESYPTWDINDLNEDEEEDW